VIPMKKDEMLKAIENRNSEKIKSLGSKELGVDPTILHYSVQVGDLKVVETLLEIGAKKWVNEFDDVAFTPLTWAARNNRLDIVKLLIGAGANVNIRDEIKIGNTVLREVIEVCSFEMASELIKAGADPTMPGWMQLTALNKASERLSASKTPENEKILELLKNR